MAEESLKCWSEQRARISLMAQESLMNPDIPRKSFEEESKEGVVCAPLRVAPFYRSDS